MRTFYHLMTIGPNRALLPVRDAAGCAVIIASKELAENHALWYSTQIDRPVTIVEKPSDFPR